MATGRGPVANYDRGQGIEKLGVFERKQAIRNLNLNASANVTYNDVPTTADCATANIAADGKA